MSKIKRVLKGPQKSPPDFTVVIVNFRSENFVDKAVSSFQQAHQEAQASYEIIVVDNRVNDSFGEANNLAVQQSFGAYLLFLNPDTICKQNILDPLQKKLREKGVGAVAPQLILSNGVAQNFAYGDFPSLRQIFGRRMRRAPKQAGGDDCVQADWVSGACLAVRREHFERLSGFSPEFKLYFEDVDLCKKLTQIKLRNFVLPKVKIIHLGGEREEVGRCRRERYFEAQKQYFAKWQPNILPLFLFLRWPYRVYCWFKDQDEAF
ncbi:MAG: glycosyltransferase [bacterium]|nr:glycosyltransferase [bacterium]